VYDFTEQLSDLLPQSY